ncbi:DUF4189 domain-containing protein [Dyella sp. LX-66]|uniref:DUF4189 domain-containing protein n=1 Tax=unclassified Dyella TaxID=2634549 RepID=UPI001BE02D46|nr:MULTISPECIES: DUF4189 domain-containing protein [unclassified Dyella]MBT2115654.1 DUF4189 domain-containing protein [Dyella sp. LX-1]MBT2139469.1 DUF4189 domain-containing protein [Dyella sp. LX-66]
MKSLLILLFCILCFSPVLHAEGGCPPGMVPQGGQGAVSCRPIPGYGQPGSQAPIPGAPQNVVWVERWGAVALDAQYTGNLGAARNKASRSEAEQIAMANCQSLGSTKCELISAFSNSCVAVAKADNHYSVATRPTKPEAEKVVIGLCDDASCKVVFSSCSTALRL